MKHPPPPESSPDASSGSSRPAPDGDSVRFVALLGASNLTLSLPEAVASARRADPERPLELHVAHGPGRSYGRPAGPLWIRYAPLNRCGLVDAIESARPERRAGGRALLTDIGNDILYGAGEHRLLEWVAGLTRRLVRAGLRVALTSLPLESIEALSARRYRLLRPLFFPLHPMPHEEMLDRVRAVQAGLERLARDEGCELLAARREWYGFDHFHIRRSARRAAMEAWVGGRGREPRAPDESRGAGRRPGTMVSRARLAIPRARTRPVWRALDARTRVRLY